jgi:hypothetical protein
MTACTAVGRHALLAMGQPQVSDQLIQVEWTSGTSAGTARPWPLAKPVTMSLILPAYVGVSSSEQLGIADIIICSRELGSSGGAEFLRAILRRYPGCAVAAAELSSDECLVMTRCGAARKFTVHHEDAEAGWPTFLCAVFVHEWLAAGQPLAALVPAQLHAFSHAIRGRQRGDLPGACCASLLRATERSEG